MKRKKKQAHRNREIINRNLPALNDLEGNMMHFKHYPQDLPWEWDKELMERRKARKNGVTRYNPEYDG